MKVLMPYKRDSTWSHRVKVYADARRARVGAVAELLC